MDQQALQELIALFLKINPQPSDQQFHALAEACGVDKETLESISYSMLGEAEDLLDDPAEFASAPSTCNDGISASAPSTAISNDDPLSIEIATSPSTAVDYGDDGEEGQSTHSMDREPCIPVAKLGASARLGLVVADSQETLNDPTLDPDTLNLSDVALNDGDPTDDDLGMQEETHDDGFAAPDVGTGLQNSVTDVLTDDGVPDASL